MGNSSDWIAALQESALPQDNDAVSWVDAMPKSSVFVDGLPAMRSAELQESCVLDAKAEGSEEPTQETIADPIEEAFARGEATGRAAAIAQFETEQATISGQQRALRLSFQDLDQAAMDCLAHDLAETVIGLCEQVLSQYVPDLEDLRDRCKEAAKRIGGASQNCALHLNPDDIERVSPETLGQWQVVSDDTVARGGLRFEGADGAVSDGPTQWRRAIAAAVRG